MGHWAGFCLKSILSVKIKIIGKENIIMMKNFLLPHLINQCLKLFTYKQFLMLQYLF